MRKRLLCVFATLMLVSLCLPMAVAASTGTVKVELHYKKDDTTQYAQDIELELYEVSQTNGSIDGLTPVQTLTSDSEGLAVFANVEYGSYVLHQANQKGAAYVFDDVAFELPYLDKDGESNNYLTIQPKVAPPATPKPAATPTPTPVPDKTLPQTGLLQWPIPVLAIGGALLVVVGCVLARRKGKNK